MLLFIFFATNTKVKSGGFFAVGGKARRCCCCCCSPDQYRTTRANWNGYVVGQARESTHHTTHDPVDPPVCSIPNNQQRTYKISFLTLNIEKNNNNNFVINNLLNNFKIKKKDYYCNLAATTIDNNYYYTHKRELIIERSVVVRGKVGCWGVV